MANYVPKEASCMNTALQLLTCTKRTVKGVNKPEYIEDKVFFASFKSYGGSEKIVNDILTVEDTAVVVCWYDPAITSDCRIKLLSDGSIYEIINKPENINQQNQFLKFKVRGIGG